MLLKKRYVGIIQRSRNQHNKFFLYVNIYGHDSPEVADLLYLGGESREFVQREIVEVKLLHKAESYQFFRLQLNESYDTRQGKVVVIRNPETAKMSDTPSINSSLKAWIYEINNEENRRKDAMVSFSKALLEAKILLRAIREDRYNKKIPVANFEGESYYIGFTDCRESDNWRIERKEKEEMLYVDLRHLFEKNEENIGLFLNPANPYGNAPLGREMIDLILEYQAPKKAKKKGKIR